MTGIQPPPYPECPPLEDGLYGRWFTDVAAWAPHVAAVASRHGLPSPEGLTPGVPGSHPVFVAAEYVVKFYAPHWPEAPGAEAAVYDVLSARRAALPVPRVLARGALYAACSEPGASDQRWAWPYVVLTRIPGCSVGEVRPRLRRGDLERAAAALGPVVRSIHESPTALEARRSWPVRWHGLLAGAAGLRGAEGGWDAELLAGLDGYVRRALGGVGARCLVHADLTEDHVLLAPDGGGRRFSGLIDFADAFVGDPSYELVALRLSVLRDAPSAMAAFRAAYGDGPLFTEGWRRRATACMLIFPFGVMGEMGQAGEAARRARSGAELEQVLWGGFEGR